MLIDSVVHTMLDTQFPTGTGTNRCYLGAHSAFSASGANLITNAKTAGAWAAASARAKAITATIGIPIGAGSTVRWIGIWGGTSGDTFYGMAPNGSTGYLTFQLDKTAGQEKIFCEGHGLANDDKVTFVGGTPPGGLTEGNVYWVVGVTAGDPDYFKVSSTQGGAAIDLTSEAAAGCVVSKIVEEVYSGAGTHNVTAFSVTM